MDLDLSTLLQTLVGGFFKIFFSAIYSTLLHLPPLRFHCVGGCWDRTQDSFDFGIGCENALSQNWQLFIKI
jgi:hypothetical protein